MGRDHQKTVMAGDTVVLVEAVPSDTSFLFTVRDVDSGEEREAIVVETEEGVRGWLNYCRHLTHITLDKGRGAEMRDGEIVCTNHGAMFRADNGYCTHGPCTGSYLESVGVEVRDGEIRLVDSRFEFVRTGGIEGDDDLSSTSNVEF